MRGATQFENRLEYVETVSIHAPHARCDLRLFYGLGNNGSFNPRTSCEVRQHFKESQIISQSFQSTHLMRGATGSHLEKPNRFQFQSTHLMRGATCLLSVWLHPYRFQSTHLMRGATAMTNFLDLQKLVSIHAPHARCDELL